MVLAYYANLCGVASLPLPANRNPGPALEDLEDGREVLLAVALRDGELPELAGGAADPGRHAERCGMLERQPHVLVDEVGGGAGLETAGQDGAPHQLPG